MTLKEILQARERTASAPAEPEKPQKDNQENAFEIPLFHSEICHQMREFYALFEGCTDF